MRLPHRLRKRSPHTDHKRLVPWHERCYSSSGKEIQPFNGNAAMESLFSTPYHDVTERAQERLRQSPHLSVRSVSCEFDRGVLRLRGRLSSFYHKQLAQEAVARLPGVTEVVNEVAVAM